MKALAGVSLTGTVCHPSGETNQPPHRYVGRGIGLERDGTERLLAAAGWEELEDRHADSLLRRQMRDQRSPENLVSAALEANEL